VRERLGAASHDTFFQHDLLGNLSQVTDAALNVATFDYDSLGRLVASCDFDRGCWSFAYDNAGNLLSSLDAKGQLTAFTYDALDRKKTKTNHAGELTQWLYDQTGHGASKGRLTTVTYPSGSEQFSYDLMGFETEIRRSTAGGGFHSVFQTYQFGRLATLQYPGGETLSYGYDGEGYLASVSGYVNAMTRNARGQLTSMLYANGVTTAIAYDNQYDLMSSIAVTGPQGPLYQAAYTYNDASQVTAIASSTHPELNVSYAYDDLYRLLSVTRAGQGTPYQAYAYDAIGNPTQASDLGSYLYTQLGKPHAATQGGTLRYAYDPNGNLASATTRTPDCVQVGRLLSWDSENRLAWASAAGKTTRYAYTADGQRNQKEGPVDTAYFYGPQLEVRWNEAGDQTLLTKYIYAGPVLVAKSESDGTKHWYHQDHLSSTVAMSDATGALAKKTEYEAFGQEIASTGAAANLRGYGSHWRDDESGLLYMGARYYDPALVGFTQPDSVVPEPDDPQSWNSAPSMASRHQL
jgi:RHS repeat-associated protein